MPEQFIPERAADGLDHLRAAVDAHAKATQASRDAGAQVRVEREQPATSTEVQR